MPIQKWEYVQLELLPRNPIAAEKMLNKMGENGWELVAVACTSTDELAAFLKRLKD
jgi:hypothetical protein